MATERYHPLFATDLGDACSHYDSIATVVGDRFRSSVRFAIRKVADRLESFGRIGGDFRGALVDRFPYVIVFTVDDGVPSIYGLRHATSDRSNWFTRTMTDKDE